MNKTYDMNIDGFPALILVLLWVAGIVIAKGFAETLVSILFPPYSWYLVIEKALIVFGVI